MLSNACVVTHSLLCTAYANDRRQLSTHKIDGAKDIPVCLRCSFHVIYYEFFECTIDLFLFIVLFAISYPDICGVYRGAIHPIRPWSFVLPVFIFVFLWVPKWCVYAVCCGCDCIRMRTCSSNSFACIIYFIYLLLYFISIRAKCICTYLCGPTTWTCVTFKQKRSKRFFQYHFCRLDGVAESDKFADCTNTNIVGECITLAKYVSNGTILLKMKWIEFYVVHWTMLCKILDIFDNETM